eukprot:6455589-Amphidinium_carterae.3
MLLFGSLSNTEGQDRVVKLLRDIEQEYLSVQVVHVKGEQQLVKQDRSSAVIARVKEIVLDIVDAENIELDAPLMESGLTSNMASLLHFDLQREFAGAKLPQTLAFDYPSIKAVSSCLVATTR